VYWEDTDAGGVVYHASYLRFLERARSEWLRARGYSQVRLQAESGLVFAVVNMQLHFRRAARLDDLLYVGCEPALAGNASVTFRQVVHRGDAGGELLLDADVRVVCVTVDRFQPRRLPEALRREFA
jgi:acyl-CoA thioester hydrolase